MSLARSLEIPANRSPRNPNTQSMIFPRGLINITPPIYPKDAATSSTRNTKARNSAQFNDRLAELCDILDNSDFSTINWSEYFTKSERYKALSPKKPTESPFDKSRNRWTHRELPTTFPSNRLHNSFLAHSLKESMGTITLKFPDYFRNLDFSNDDAIPFQMESETWIYFLNEIIAEVSATSKSTAVLLETMKSRLTTVFEKMVDFIAEEKKIVEVVKTVVKECPSEVENARLLALNESLKSRIQFLEKDVKKLKEDNIEMKKESIQAQSEQQQAEAQAFALSEYNNDLRSRVTLAEQKIYALSQSNHIFKSSGTLGNVPKDVLVIWEQLSHFVNLIGNGALDSIDFSSYFPKNISKEFEAPFFQLPKCNSSSNEEQIHYTTFFDMMRKSVVCSDPARLHYKLENNIRNMLSTISKVYVDRAIEFQNNDKEIKNKLIKTLKDLHTKNDQSLNWVCQMVENGVLIKLRKTDSDNITFYLKHLIENVSSNFYQKKIYMHSVNEILINSFPFDQLIVFLKTISDGKGKKLIEELLYRFMNNHLSLDSFLFFCNAYKRSQTESLQLIFSSYFDHLGWNHDNDVEDIFVDVEKTLHYFIALYNYSVKEIAKSIGKINHEQVISILLDEGLNEAEAEDANQWLLSISDGQITSSEIAIFHFWRRNKFEVLRNFDFDDSTFVNEINELLSKKKSKKKAKSPRKGAK